MDPTATQAHVALALPSGAQHILFHGDLIGRLWSAALRLDDARISEAHAMISQRGRDVKLLALRGRFMADGRAVRDIALSAGMRITLAPGFDLQVVDVQAPESVLRVSAPGLAARDVHGVLSLYGGAAPRIRSGWRPDADGTLWPTGAGWMRSGEPPVAVEAPGCWDVDGVVFSVERVPTEGGVAPTRRTAGLQSPLTLVARYDTVHIQRDGRTVVALSGRSARLVSELAVMQAPCDWAVLALDLWGEMGRDRLRRCWDMQLQRLRKKLKTGGVHADLVRATGQGQVELVLGTGDRVVDQT